MRLAVCFAILAALIGGLLGSAAGFKIEQHRTRDEVGRLKAQGDRADEAPVALRKVALGQRVGLVAGVAGDTITLGIAPHRQLHVRVTSATRCERATTGSSSDIVVGSRVLLTIRANDVIVLPQDSLLGRRVSRVTPDSFSIDKVEGGVGATVRMNSVKHIDKITLTKLADVKAGMPMLAGGRTIDKTTFGAVEIITLPKESGFVG